MIPRSVEPLLRTALRVAPIVLLKGARQVGKSTLALSLGHHYVVLDDVSARIFATEDPKRFIESLSKPVCIDEIQKAPQLLEALKLYVDRQRRNGDFLITGSANLLDMKRAKDTLAGRIVEITLHPFSLSEIQGGTSRNVVDELFRMPDDKNLGLHESGIHQERIVEDLLKGFYPESIRLANALERRLWFASYISTYIERDARDMAELRDIDSFFRFVNVLAPRSTGLLNKSELSKEIGIRSETLENYLTVMAQTFQITLLRPYYENIGKQFVKSPKLYLNDTGLMCYFLRLYNREQFEQSEYKGALIETLVCNELLKHIAFCQEPTDLFFYRTSDKKEIDFLLVRNDRIIAIEVKASASLDHDAFRHIRDFQRRSRKKVTGIVFYLGDRYLPYGDDCAAIPLTYFY